MCAFLVHEARGSVQVGCVARGAATRSGQHTREEAGWCQGVGWERDTWWLFPLGVGGIRGIVFIAPSSPAVTAWECWPEGPLPRCPRQILQNQAVGGPPGQGCLRRLCRVMMGDPFMGTPFSAPEHPSVQVVAGWPARVLLERSAWRLFIGASE